MLSLFKLDYLIVRSQFDREAFADPESYGESVLSHLRSISLDIYLVFIYT